MKNMKITSENLNQVYEKERIHEVWNMRLLHYPIWIHFRHLFFENAKLKKNIKLSLKRIILGLMHLFIFAAEQLFKKKTTYFFTNNRPEAIAFYNAYKGPKTLFLIIDSPNNKNLPPHRCAEGFYILRFLIRKIGFLFFFQHHRSFINKIKSASTDFNISDKTITALVKLSIGEAIWRKFLSKTTRRENKIFYSKSVFPMGMKFFPEDNAFELQHGVVFPGSYAYFMLPQDLKIQSLGVYDKLTLDTMLEHKSSQPPMLLPHQISHQTSKMDSQKIILLTSPVKTFQDEVSAQISKLSNAEKKRIFIQKHPSDTYNYPIEPSQYVSNISMNTNAKLVFYYSSLAFQRLSKLKTAYIFDCTDDTKAFFTFLPEAYREKLDFITDIKDIF